MAETKVRAPKTHCKRGHELTDKNVRIKNKGNGRYARECRLCHNMKSNERRRMQSASYARRVDSVEKPTIRKVTTKSILGTTAFGNDCFSHAQIMAFRRSE